MGELLQPWHLILIAIVALIFFGPRKLPELGKGLGEGWRGFKDGLKRHIAGRRRLLPIPRRAHTS